MIQVIRAWFNRYFSDPEAVLLFFLLLFGCGLIMLIGDILAPILASVVIAYLLEWVIGYMQRLNVPRLPAVIFVFVAFLVVLLVALLVLLPLLWQQVVSLFDDLPSMLLRGQQLLLNWVEQFPQFFAEDQINTFTGQILTEARNWAKVVLSVSWSSITVLMTAIVYLILVPLLVFFFLKDKVVILKWLSSFLPTKRGMLKTVFLEVNDQIGNYIRGKSVEILVISLVTYAVFEFFNLRYAVLLAFLVGVSALIPYIGGILSTIPVMLVAYFQWGWTWSEFGYLMIAYSIIQGLESNLLVPLLFSEAVNLHPIAIISATLFFGGIWGVWGVFFAIPLATLVKAVLNAWPKDGPPAFGNKAS